LEKKKPPVFYVLFNYKFLLPAADSKGLRPVLEKAVAPKSKSEWSLN